MQPTTKSSTGNPLLDYLLASGNQSQNVQNIMNGPVGQMVTNRQNYLDQTNNDIGSTLKSLLNNGQSGYAVNAGPSAAELNSNFAGNNSITQGLLGQILSSATGLATNAQSVAGSVANTQTQNATQNRGLNLQYGETDPMQQGNGTGSSLSGIDAENQVTQQGGKDILDQAGSDPAKYKLAQSIVTAGGVGAYRKANPQSIGKDNASTLGSTNDTLQKINFVSNQLQKSKTLSSLINTPGLNQLMKMNNQWLNSALGLSPQDQQALSYMTQLNSLSDKSQVGGRLDNYLLQRLGPSGVSADRSTQTNLQLLQEMKDHIVNNNLKPFATSLGYKSVYDLPYIQFGQPDDKHPNGAIQMINPADKKTYTVDQSEANDALQNGWKEVQ